tara:strand:- start:193 stop:519 length:327 start_codon:yes stop_codon:yes gene_type:complete
MVRPNNNQNDNNDNEVLISTDEYLQLGVDLQEALDTRRELGKAELHSMELAWALSNTDIAPYTGGVKDIVQYANDFDPTMQNGKIVDEDYFHEDEVSNDAYSRWEHLT